MQMLHDGFSKTINIASMELYADKIELELIDGMLELTIHDGDNDYMWVVPMLELWGLNTTDSVNLIVDTFRQKYKVLGV